MRIFPLEHEIDFDKGLIPVVHISNPKYFRKVVSNMKLLSEGQEVKENIVLVDDGKIVDFHKDAYICLDFYSFDPNQKKILNSLYQYIERNYSFEAEHLHDFNMLMNSTINNLQHIIEDIPFELEFRETPGISDFIKMIGLKVYDFKSNNIIDRILLLLNVIAFTKTLKIVVFVNLKMFLTEQEIIEVYKCSLYNELTILLIEYGEPKEKGGKELILWIDEDYAEVLR